MAKGKSAIGYERELREMIHARTGVECEPWLIPQVRTTAANMVVLDKMLKEITEQDSLVTMTIGSTGQPVSVVNPLITHFNNMQRTLMLQFEALGLNYKTTPRKVTEPTKKGGSEHDKLTEMFNELR